MLQDISVSYPAISSTKDYLLIWRPDEACNSILLHKLVAYRLFVTPDENITLLVNHFHFNGCFNRTLDNQ